MGMSGYYLAVDTTTVKEIKSGNKSILSVAENHNVLDIDKSWQAIQHLLCGTIDEAECPMAYVVPRMFDTLMTSECDFHAFELTVSEVSEAYEYLKSLSDDKLKSMYDFKSMLADEVYPLVADDDEEELFKYIHINLQLLKDFYKKATEEKNAVIFYII